MKTLLLHYLNLLREYKIRYNRRAYKDIPPYMSGEHLYFPEFCIKSRFRMENPPYIYNGEWYIDNRRFASWDEFGHEYCIDKNKLDVLKSTLNLNR